MNVYDSDRMADLVNNNYSLVKTPEVADAILLNTCHIREKAAEKVYSEIGKYSDLKNFNKNLKIVVAGCVAQQEGEALLRRVPELDLVMGPQHANRLRAHPASRCHCLARALCSACLALWRAIRREHWSRRRRRHRAAERQAQGTLGLLRPRPCSQ